MRRTPGERRRRSIAYATLRIGKHGDKRLITIGQAAIPEVRGRRSIVRPLVVEVLQAGALGKTQHQHHRQQRCQNRHQRQRQEQFVATDDEIT